MRPAASSFARRPGVAYAPAPDGHELPVIDVTNPAFRVDSSAEGVEALRRSLASARFKLVPRGVEVFAALAGNSGWRLARWGPALISDQVLLQPA